MDAIVPSLARKGPFGRSAAPLPGFRSTPAEEQLDLSDVLIAARTNHGIATLEEIHLAVLERNGDISVIPRKSS